MKTIKLKVLAIVGMMVGCVTILNCDTRAQNLATYYSTGQYQKENLDIKNDVAYINLHETRIAELEKQYKKDKESGNELAAAKSKSVLRKEKAELRRDQAYLKANMALLKCNRNVAIKSLKAEMKKDRENYALYNKRLQRDIENGDSESAQRNAAAAARYKNQLKSDELAISRERKHLDNNLAAIDKELNKPAKHSVVISESALARVDYDLTNK